MNSIIADVTNKKAPRSTAFSTKSVFSTMRPGAFFKVVDSPFKISLMSTYDKMN